MIKNTLKHVKAALGVGVPPRPWRELLSGRDDWAAAKASAKGGKRVLLATSLGGYENGVLLESILAAALTMRGAETDLLLCDAALPACQLSKITKVPPERFAAKGPKDICFQCVQAGKAMYEPLGLPIHAYGSLIGGAEARIARELARTLPIEGIGDYKYEGLAAGEHAMAGTLRYFARGDLKNEPLSEPILRRYLEAAMRTIFAIRALLRKHKYDAVCFHHGIYVPQGLIGEVCRQEGVRVINSNPAYRKQTFVFSHGDTYHHTMITEPVSTWENIEWTPATEKRTMDYLKSRWYGTNDWIWFHEDPQGEIGKIAAELGVDFSKPCVGMLTSVMWDAQLHYRANAFPTMLDWVMKTITYFAKRPELQLIIRVHPAEVRGMIPSRQLLMDEIRAEFPKLPLNVFVIPPESKISTYAVMERCGSVIIFNTKTGIELSSMGIPVVVAGEAWIRNKGFSVDASSEADYFRILDGLPDIAKLEGEILVRARKYAYHFFYRRMLDFPFVDSKEKFRFSLDVKDLSDLKAGKHSGLDTICDGILTGSPFVQASEVL